MATEYVTGIEKIEFGVPGANGALPTAWVAINNIEENSVTYTGNTDNKTYVNVEDKDLPVLVLRTPGNPDTIAFATIEVSEQNYNALFNTAYDATKSTVTVLATRAPKVLAIRLTSRPQLGVKKVYTFPNVLAVAALKNNFTKNATVAISVTGDIMPFTTTTGQQAIYTVQTVNADNSTIDSVPPTVNAGADASVTAANTTLTGTATAADSKTISSTTWSQVSGPNQATLATPDALTTNVSGMVTGVYVFRLTVIDSAGTQATDDVQITATVA